MKKRSGLEADIGSLTVAKTNCKPIKNVFFNGFDCVYWCANIKNKERRKNINLSIGYTNITGYDL